MINCEECPFFNGGVFSGFRCVKAHPPRDGLAGRYLFTREACPDFRQMTAVELIRRRWHFARASELRNRGIAVKRLVGGLRNQLREDGLGRYLASDEIADLRSAATALERIAKHIETAARLHREDELVAAETHRREAAEERRQAALAFFGDAPAAELALLAHDLSHYMAASKLGRSSNIEYSADRFQKALATTGSAQDDLKEALYQAVGEEVKGFGDMTAPHFFSSNHKLTLADFRVFHDGCVEARRVEEVAKSSPNVVILKKTQSK